MSTTSGIPHNVTHIELVHTSLRAFQGWPTQFLRICNIWAGDMTLHRWSTVCVSAAQEKVYILFTYVHSISGGISKAYAVPNVRCAMGSRREHFELSTTMVRGVLTVLFLNSTPERLWYLWLFAYSAIRGISPLELSTDDQNIVFYSGYVAGRKRMKRTYQFQRQNTSSAPSAVSTASVRRSP